MDEKNQKLGYKSMTECVMDYLKQRLLDGEICPGEEINLTTLSETLGVSRTPVREALIQLMKDGFIEGATRKGFRIKQADRREIRDLYEIGGLLESEIVKAACDAMTGEQIEQLEAIQRKIEDALERSDAKAYLDYNAEFNALLWGFCPNRVLNEFSSKIRERLYFARKRLGYPEWNRMLVSDHREIIGLLRTKDMEALVRLLREKHWSFDRNYPFIRQFYKFPEEGEKSG